MYDIPLIKPVITDALKQRVLDVLDTGYLTEGPVTRQFEQAVQEFTGAGHCLAVTSCTTGLELALRCLGIGPGDEVVVPDYTYPATASAVNIVGATAVIADVDPATMLLDTAALTRALSPRTRAIMPVSLFGNPLDHAALSELKDEYGFHVVEDAACSLGAEYGGQRTGTLSDITVFSCHPRKFVTTGEGGLVTTDSGQWADWMRSYKHFGMGCSDSRLTAEFERVGTNYKLSNVLAAIGLEQMTMVDHLLAERRRLAQGYMERLGNTPGVRLPVTTAGGTHSWQTFCVQLADRDAVMARMREAGVEAQIGTYALHMHRAFNDNPLCRIDGSMKGSRQAFDTALALPLYHGMTDAEQDRVLHALTRSMQQ